MKLVTLHNDIEVRVAAIGIAKWAVDAGGSGQRMPPDPIHEFVTEGRRTQWEKARKAGADWAMRGSYSSCGDLAHTLLYLLGCRDERLVNRDSDGGVTPWRSGVNISRLVSAPGYVHAMSGARPSVGDILHVCNAPGTDHVSVLVDFGTDSLSSCDYGQPYGKLTTREVKHNGGLLVVGGRRLVGWLDVTQIARTELAIVPSDIARELDQPYSEDAGLMWKGLVLAG